MKKAVQLLNKNISFYLPIFIFIFLSLSQKNWAIIPQKEFNFSNDPIDVVIPSTEKDKDTLEFCIDGIKKNCAEVRRIIIISKKHLTDKAEWYPESSFPITKDMIVDEIFQDEELARAYKKNPKNRTGWIYQQILKLYAPFVIPNISSNVLILDSDTIFLNPVSFIGSNGAACFNPGTEHHAPYFVHMKKILPDLYRVYPSYSGISHHMLFQRCVLEDLFSMIENLHQKPMWKAMLHCIDHARLFDSSMSEYEIYFNYALLRSKQFTIRKLRWENVNSISCIPEYKMNKYHYVSAHAYMRTS